MNVNELQGIKTRVFCHKLPDVPEGCGFKLHFSFICTGAETAEGKTDYFYMAKTSDRPGRPAARNWMWYFLFSCYRQQIQAAMVNLNHCELQICWRRSRRESLDILVPFPLALRVSGGKSPTRLRRRSRSDGSNAERRARIRDGRTLEYFFSRLCVWLQQLGFSLETFSYSRAACLCLLFYLSGDEFVFSLISHHLLTNHQKLRV